MSVKNPLKEVRVAFIGCGVISHSHMRSYVKMPNVKVVAACDIDKPRLDAWCEQYGVPEDARYTNYEEMLKRDDIDSVDVCVHNNLHLPMVLAALRSGRHCFCEKPIAASYVDAKRMYDVWQELKKETGVELAVQIGTVFSAQTRNAKKMVQNGDLGHVYYVRCLGHRRRNRPGLDSDLSVNFYNKELAGHGATFDMGVYHIGQMLYILGLPKLERVVGKCYLEPPRNEKLLEGREFGVEDLGLAFATFENGLTFEFMESWALNVDEVGDSFIAGSKGGLRFTSRPGSPFNPMPQPDLKLITTVNDQDIDVDLRVSDYENVFYENKLDPDTRFTGNFEHWIAYLTGQIDERIDTALITLNTAFLSEGIFLSSELGREVKADEIEALSVSNALKKQETEWGTFEYTL